MIAKLQILFMCKKIIPIDNKVFMFEEINN